jgi:methylphosphotriester-DNA--protein-cysteine methyltransferase
VFPDSPDVKEKEWNRLFATLEHATGQNGLKLVNVLEHAEKERPLTREHVPEWANVPEPLLSSFRVSMRCVPDSKNGANGNRVMQHAGLVDNREPENATDKSTLTVGEVPTRLKPVK